MPNSVAVFTTNRDADHGSSLYLVTTEWVIRCSGNTNGREATTFARKRSIEYSKPGAIFSFPALGLSPVEGGHTGNEISAVLNSTGDIPQQAPENWVERNGVSWAVAAQEVLAAESATHTHLGENGRFSRLVGELAFSAD